jgi:hypothetical protein
MKYLDLRPRTDRWIEKTIVTMIGVVLLLLLASIAWGQVPPDAVKLHTQPFPCSGQAVFYDTDGDFAGGAEVVTVETNDGDILAILEFGPGAHGDFLKATITLPGSPPEVFTDRVALGAKYGDPCALIGMARKRT